MGRFLLPVLIIGALLAGAGFAVGEHYLDRYHDWRIHHVSSC